MTILGIVFKGCGPGRLGVGFRAELVVRREESAVEWDLRGGEEASEHHRCVWSLRVGTLRCCTRL